MLATLLLLAAAAGADPLAEARAGKIQCVNPNLETRSCVGMSRYSVRSDGSFDSVTSMLVEPSPLVIMEVRSSGKVEGDAVCTVVRRADYERATMALEGGPVKAEVEQAIGSQISASISSMEGRNLCARDRPVGDAIVAEMTVDGGHGRSWTSVIYG